MGELKKINRKGLTLLHMLIKNEHLFFLIFCALDKDDHFEALLIKDKKGCSVLEMATHHPNILKKNF